MAARAWGPPACVKPLGPKTTAARGGSRPYVPVVPVPELLPPALVLVVESLSLVVPEPVAAVESLLLAGSLVEASPVVLAPVSDPGPVPPVGAAPPS